MEPLVPLKIKLALTGVIGATENQIGEEWSHWWYKKFNWCQLEPLVLSKLELVPTEAIGALKN